MEKYFTYINAHKIYFAPITYGGVCVAFPTLNSAIKAAESTAAQKMVAKYGGCDFNGNPWPIVVIKSENLPLKDEEITKLIVKTIPVVKLFNNE